MAPNAKVRRIIAAGSYSDLVGTKPSDILTLKEGQRLDVDEGYIEALTITPEFAAELLKNRHPNQRMIRHRHVDELAQSMVEGKWHATLDPIKLDEDLHLIDGQHRLLALIKAKVSVKFLVAILNDPDAFYAIDQNAPRSINDIRATLGKKPVHGTLRGAILLERREFSEHRAQLSKEDLDAILDSFEYMPELLELWNCGGPKQTKLASVGVLGAAIACLRANRNDAMRFFKAVLTMSSVIDGEEVSQVYLLYMFLMLCREKAREGRRSGEAFIRESAYKSIRAWNAWRRGEILSKLQYDPGAKFPKVSK